MVKCVFSVHDNGVAVTNIWFLFNNQSLFYCFAKMSVSVTAASSQGIDNYLWIYTLYLLYGRFSQVSSAFTMFHLPGDRCLYE